MAKLRSSLSKFDESNLQEHQAKVLFGCGCLMGFRGGEEHTYLKRSQITSGKFPDDHPSFPGNEWWGLAFFDKTKTHKFDMNQVYVEDMDDLLRFPVLSDGMKGDLDRDFGGALKRYCEKLPPNTKEDRFYIHINKKTNRFKPNHPIGKNTIREIFKTAFKILLIENWDKLHPHALGAAFCTIVANGNMNDQEKLRVCRHKDMNTNAGYQTTCDYSEGQRLNAILGPAPENMSSVSSPESKSSSKSPFIPQTASTVAALNTPSTEIEMKQYKKNIVSKDERPEPRRKKYRRLHVIESDDEEEDIIKKNSNQIVEIDDDEDCVPPPTSAMSIYTQREMDGLQNDFIDTFASSHRNPPVERIRSHNISTTRSPPQNSSMSSFTQREIDGLQNDIAETFPMSHRNPPIIEDAHTRLSSRYTHRPTLPSFEDAHTMERAQMYTHRFPEHVHSRDNMYTASGDFTWGYGDVYSPRQVREQQQRGRITSYFAPASSQSARNRVPSERENAIVAIREDLRRSRFGRDFFMSRDSNQVARDNAQVEDRMRRRYYR